MKVKLERIDLWNISKDKISTSYNSIHLRTEGGAKIEFPVSYDFFKKLEQMILTEMSSEINKELSTAIVGCDKPKEEFYLLNI